MNKKSTPESNELAEHFFRNEYGRLVSVVTRLLGTPQMETAEDIVQETLLKAVSYWQHHGTPPNPQAWLYTTAKNLTLNVLKRNKHQDKYESEASSHEQSFIDLEKIDISEALIADEQLRMIFACCSQELSENAQIALVLKILCGFSISEIATAFFSSNETINKRLVRARKQMRENYNAADSSENIKNSLNAVLKTIYLLFNEGYKPSQVDELVRTDLCFEAIRLSEILIAHEKIKDKSDCYALSALMYLNVSRFKARINVDGIKVEMKDQDRNLWNQEMIGHGLQYLDKITANTSISSYHIMAAISANHCVAPNFEKTNWQEILSLYDQLIVLDDTPIIRLNRSVALSKIKGYQTAIEELKKLDSIPEMSKYPIFQATLAEFHLLNGESNEAEKRLRIAISLTKHKPDLEHLQKKLAELVPI